MCPLAGQAGKPAQLLQSWRLRVHQLMYYIATIVRPKNGEKAAKDREGLYTNFR